MTTNNQQVVLAEQDIAYTLLCDLKRVVREYATAATESSCPTIRTLNTQLLNTALKSQGDLYNVMQAAQLYDQPLVAPQSVIKQQIDSYKQSEQKLNQFLAQNQSTSNFSQQSTTQNSISS